MSSGDPRPIRSAGAVVLRGQGSRRAVALVHRPAYNDWSLPKGKLEKREPPYAAAVREVEEETGVRIRLGAPLSDVSYRVIKGPKLVHFWVGYAVSETARRPDHEVDEVEWVPIVQARERLTYPDETAILEEALAIPETTAFVVVRHAKALLRKDWAGDDSKRPIDAKGKAQASNLVDLLDAYGIGLLKSSTSTRCVQTLEPYAKTRRLSIKPVSLLSEEVGEEHLAGVQRYVRKLLVKAGATGTGTAVCGHRPVLPAMIAGLDLEPRPMTPGTSLVVHVDDEGMVVAHEWHPPHPV
ncbi:MAG TPA: NUDIX hydrolase [Propionibacteriaceae bacterium]|nr:NUDIX hydrolase [Propionibacteriaceae bacterium]